MSRESYECTATIIRKSPRNSPPEFKMVVPKMDRLLVCCGSSWDFSLSAPRMIDCRPENGNPNGNLQESEGGQRFRDYPKLGIGLWRSRRGDPWAKFIMWIRPLGSISKEGGRIRE